VDFLLAFWQRDSEYDRSKKLDGRTLSNAYLGKTIFYIESLVKTHEPLKNVRLSQVTPRILDKWRTTEAVSNLALFF